MSRATFKKSPGIVCAAWYNTNEDFVSETAHIAMRTEDSNSFDFGLTNETITANKMMRMKKGDDDMYVCECAVTFTSRSKANFSIISFFINFFLQFNMFQRHEKYESGGCVIYGYNQFYLCESSAKNGFWKAINMYDGTKCNLFMFDRGSLYLHPYITIIYIHLMHLLSIFFPEIYGVPHIPAFNGQDPADLFDDCRDVVLGAAMTGDTSLITRDIATNVGIDSSVIKSLDMGNRDGGGPLGLLIARRVRAERGDGDK